MSIRFAPARKATPHAVSRALLLRNIRLAANDNGPAERAVKERALLHTALHHFSTHGLGAAREAYRQAEKAFFAGDRAAHAHWLEICHVLDHQILERLSRGKSNQQHGK